MNSVIPKYCVNQDPKSKCMQEMLSSYNNENGSWEDKALNDEIKADLEYLSNFNPIILKNIDTETTYRFEDENGSVILSGKANPLDKDLISLSNTGKSVLRIQYSDGNIKDVGVGAPMKKCKILSSSSLLSYITIHPPMISVVKYDIRDMNNKVYLTVESENCFSSDFLVKASNGIKTIAQIKGKSEQMELIILDSENLNLISKVSLIALLVLMKSKPQANNGNCLQVA